jgi:hypothetical protein
VDGTKRRGKGVNAWTAATKIVVLGSDNVRSGYELDIDNKNEYG